MNPICLVIHRKRWPVDDIYSLFPGCHQVDYSGVKKKSHPKSNVSYGISPKAPLFKRISDGIVPVIIPSGTTNDLIEAAKVGDETSAKALLSSKEKDILLEPSEKRTVLIGCQYYKTKAVLTRLKEMQTIIGIRKKYNKGKKKDSFLILYRSAISGGPLQRIPDEESKKIAKSEPMIVFDGDVRAGIDREGLAEIIQKHTLEKLILTSDAVFPQYGCINKLPTTIDDIPVIEARDEVRLYEKYWKEINCVPNQSPVFKLDHVLFNTIGNEMFS